MDYYLSLKIFVEQYSGLERDALHVHAALFLYLLTMVVFRQTRRSRFPWLFVLAVEVGNEYFDIQNAAAAGNPDIAWDESLKDIWNTMLWPTVLLLIGRYTTLFQYHGPAKKDDAPVAGEVAN